MEEYITFISDNYIVFLIMLLVIIFSVIGYLSDKKGFLKKKDKINNFNSEKNDSVKLKDEAVSTLKSNLNNPTNETQEQLIEPKLTNNQEENIESQEKVEPSTEEQGLDESTNETQEQLIEPELTNNQEENIDSQEKVEPSTKGQGLDGSTNETQEQLIEPELTNNQEENIDSQKDDDTNITVDNDNLKTNDLNNDNDTEENNLNDILEQIKNLKIPNIDGMDQDIENKEKIDEEDIWKF